MCWVDLGEFGLVNLDQVAALIKVSNPQNLAENRVDVLLPAGGAVSFKPSAGYLLLEAARQLAKNGGKPCTSAL